MRQRATAFAITLRDPTAATIAQRLEAPRGPGKQLPSSDFNCSGLLPAPDFGERARTCAVSVRCDVTVGSQVCDGNVMRWESYDAGGGVAGGGGKLIKLVLEVRRNGGRLSAGLVNRSKCPRALASRRRSDEFCGRCL